jgi:hypothetical protein
MPFSLQGATSGNGAEVDTLNRLETVSPKTQDVNSNPTNIGGGDRMVVEIDAGTVTGSPTIVSILSNEFRRLKIGLESLLFHEMFNGTAINTSQWSTTLTTFTNTVAGGKSVLNAGSSVATSAVAAVKSYRTMPLYSGFPTIFEAVASYQAAISIVPNNTTEIGLGYTATNAAPTDGVFFRWNNAGNFVCVVNYGGTETISSPLTPPVPNDSHVFRIVVGRLYCSFWVDGIMQAYIATPAGAGLPVQTQNLPVSLRTYNSTTSSPVSAVQLAVYSVSCYLGDQDVSRSYELAMAGLGANSIQGQTSGTVGTTANHANSTAATAATLSNTTAGYAKLGGKFLFSTVAGAVTDYALFAFQVPAASANTPGKTLYIRGVHVSSMNIGAAVATTATVLQWGIGVGATAVSLATAEAATTKAPRVIDLGLQTFPIGAAIGAMPQNGDLDVQFPYPLMCEAGNYVHIILSLPIGTATASQQIQGTVVVNGMFE